MKGELLFEEKLNDCHIDKYFIKRYSSGIICLQINTHEKWVDYGVIYSSDGLKISIDYIDKTKDSPHCMYIAKLKFQKPVNTIKLEQQDDDQISLYFIPYELLDIIVKKR